MVRSDIVALETGEQYNGAGIYRITCLAIKAAYIGAATNVFERIYWGHIPHLRSNKHKNRNLQYLWNTYGEGNFVIELLEKCQNCDEAFDKEPIYIRDYDGLILNQLRRKYVKLVNHTQDTPEKAARRGQGIKETWTSEKKARQAEKMVRYHKEGRMKQVWSPERRAKQAEKMRGYWQQGKLGKGDGRLPR